MTDRGFDSPERGISSALTEQARVVSALMLRDIKTRFGATYFGFLVGLMFPLAHIGIVLIVYVVLGRRAPIGTDVTFFLASAVVPFVVWSYTHQKTMQAFGQNRALTAFPIVKMADIWIARALVEMLNAFLIVAVVMIALSLTDHDLFLFDPPAAFYCIILAYFLGISTGYLFGLLSILAPAAMVVGFVLIPLYWATSGVFFIPDGLPEGARLVTALFPLSHIVDFGRTAIFPSYISEYSHLGYVHALIAGLLLICLLFERFFRPALTSK